ncbi:acyl-CoA dehydrogenase family protein [Phenylobacterium sp.]|uniref:acyl-CoA dehydrogenase family protein n=1 Tax=Phenylobacterium sp. TaxID=1871053 RepID=UPI002F4048B3
MQFEHSEKTKALVARVARFMDEHIYPNLEIYARQEHAGERWKAVPIVDELKAKARAEGLWNMFMPPHSGQTHVDDTFKFEGVQLTNLEFAAIAEMLGRVGWSSEVFNCSAPDTGNMEVLMRYGTLAQKERWLRPLMNGEIRSAFLMTEPAVASSDASNIETRIERDGDDYVINGRKWFSSGAGHPRCGVYILMGKTDPGARTHAQQSMVLVPAGTSGVTLERMLPVFGYDHASHGGHMQVLLENVRVPVEEALLLGEGRGFEIAQGRLGPGRIHHCMRIIGACEVALEKMCRRLLDRVAFGKALAEHSIWEQRIAEARIDIEMCRLLCLKAAWMMDVAGNKSARAEIAMVKVAAPRIACKVIDDAIQAHGGAGVTADFGLAELYASNRIHRITDGPDEVHARTIARMELGKYAPTNAPRQAVA